MWQAIRCPRIRHYHIHSVANSCSHEITCNTLNRMNIEQQIAESVKTCKYLCFLNLLISRQPCSATPAPLRGKYEWLGVRRPALVSIASTFERMAGRGAYSPT